MVTHASMAPLLPRLALALVLCLAHVSLTNAALGLRYDFEAADDTTQRAASSFALDSSGNGLHGQIVGDARPTDRQPSLGVVGGIVGAQSLRCVDGGVSTVLPTNDPPHGITGEATRMMWLRTDGASAGAMALVGIGSTSQSIAELRLLAGRPQLFVQAGGAISVVPSTTAGLEALPRVDDGEWHHIAVTADGTGVGIHVDGRSVVGLLCHSPAAVGRTGPSPHIAGHRQGAHSRLPLPFSASSAPNSPPPSTPPFSAAVVGGG